ncbi:hypothetical protein HYQ45_010644 [Verticillium longisporum]|uniref:Rhodopsin domain-containing protein n=2 Tax=Verticillium TaxID=1036719 RepID=A0A8I2ZFS6_VERLO|nr:Putative ribosomal RNA methyltransferase nop2 [Verticillium dahliae VDG2]KAF3359998.1 hypothetical protein VdG1_01688 [Verticillium dahliae VDG1]KAG7130539.1 hypothetical protein HYQ45_010644 [Verticillium longisporum]KAH6710492.1 hypothetical protein EV126DRAFT_25029 [Verticillium dahliae]PNH33372.1 hypothetical protein BJF96_g3502 [Verticillium dahliae]
MPLYSDPPTLRTFDQDKPTLLVCWWITIFCTVMIVLRVVGRFIRTEKLFREDKVVSLALIPMYLRMGCVHFILLYGTNNADFTGVTLSEKQHRQRQIASGLVLASRLLYAATLWILKDTILEYFRRLTETTSERYASQTLLFIRVALIATFIAIFISNFAECQPFAHYWQVLPDPGGQCRQGYAQLITMATCNIITDLLLVVFPIPMVLRSQLGLKKKVQLTLLFSLSLAVVVVTCYRVPNILRAHGNQQLRSLMASVELLFATTAANSLVLGSFVRDRGVKKKKFKYGSVAVDSLERTITSRSRRPTLHRHWGSDEDLVRDIGLGVEADLQNIPEYGDGVVRRGAYTPAPMARRFAEDLKHWNFPERQRSHAERSERSEDPLINRELHSSRSNSTTTPRRVSFFDVGGLLSEEGQDPASSSYGRDSFRRDSFISSVDPLSPNTSHSLPSPALPAPSTGQRRGSTALLQDMGVLFGPSSAKPPRHKPRSGTELQPIPQSRHSDMVIFDPASTSGPQLMDPGGLLR